MEGLSYYTITVLVLLVFWTIIALTKPLLRKEMITIGVLSLFLLPLSVTLKHAGNTDIASVMPLFQCSDAVFTFSLSGIAASIFHVIFGKHYHKIPKLTKGKDKDSAKTDLWFTRIFILFFAFVWSVIILEHFLQLSISTSLLVSSIFVTIYIISHRKDLLVDSLMSSALTTFIVIFASSISGIFIPTQNNSIFISDKIFLGIPIEFLVWAIALGLLIGPLYEFIRRLELK